MSEVNDDKIEEIHDEKIQISSESSRTIIEHNSAIPPQSPIMTTTTAVKGKSPIKVTTFGVEICPENVSDSENVQQNLPSLTEPGPSGISGGGNVVETFSLSDSSSAAGFKPQQHKASSQLQSPSRMTVYDNGGTHLEIQTLPHSSDKRYQCLNSAGNSNHDRVHTAGSVESDHSIECLDTLLPSILPMDVPVDDPIVIRGNGNMTLFGLSNSFSSTFPSALLGRVSREEFEHTMNCINHLLQQQHSTNAKFLLLGCLCCCCSLGCSLLWPSVALSKRTRNSLDKVCYFFE